jgi:hypothetical protein
MASNSAPVVAANKIMTMALGGTSPLGIAAPVDPDGDPLTIKVTLLPSKGVLLLNGKPVVMGQSLTAAQLSSLTYQSPSATAGVAGYFSYQVSDGKGGVASQTLAMNIVPAAVPPPSPATSPPPPPPPVNHAPVVQENKAVTVGLGSQSALGITAPTDIDGDAMTIRISSLPMKGAVFLNGRAVTRGQTLTSAQLASLSFQAPAVSTGPMGAFSYYVSDGKGGYAIQSISLNVIQSAPPPVNQAPVAQLDKVVSVALNGQGQLGIPVPTDADGDALTIKVTGLPANGAVALANGQSAAVGQVLTAAQLSSLIYTAPVQQGVNMTLGNAGIFTYQVSDGKGGLAQQNVTFDIKAPAAPPPTNHAPTLGAGPGALGLFMNTPTPLNIKAPSDADGDALTITVTGMPRYGAMSLADGTSIKAGDKLTAAQLTGLVYRPVVGMTGQAGQFTYSVSDPYGASVSQTAGIVVWASPVGTGVVNPAGLFDVSRQAFVARPSALFNLGDLFQVKAGAALPAALTINMLDVNRYAGAETKNYGTLTARTGEAVAAGSALSFALVNGQYIKTGLGGTAGLTLRDFVFSASTQEDRVQNFEITAYDQTGKAIDNRSVSITTSSTWVDPTPGVATAAEMVQVAQSYLGKTWDSAGCWNLAQDIAVKAGATLSMDSWAIGQKNAGANGQWGVAYDASKGQNANWMASLQAGDVVEFAWKNNATGHIATVSRVAGGQSFIIDNGGALVAGTNGADCLIAESSLSQVQNNISAATVIVYRLNGAQPVSGNLAPTVAANFNADVLAGQSIAAGALFQTSDADNNAITAYRVRDNSAGGGYFSMNGVKQAEGQWIDVAPGSLASLAFKAGAGRGVDGFDVQAFDGTSWSAAEAGRVVTLGSQTLDDTTTWATNLGALTANSVLKASDVLSRSDVHDFYAFTLASAASVTISLGDLSADCALDLYSGAPGVGQIAGDHMFGTNAKTVSVSLAAGTYYVDANYSTGSLQNNASNYDLTVCFAQNAAAALGALASNAALPVVPMAGAVVAGANPQIQPGMLLASS